MLVILFILLLLTATVQGQESSSPLIHRISVDARPAYIAPSSKSLRDDSENGLHVRKAASFHLKYGFQFHPDSPEGKAYPYTSQGIGVSYNTFWASRELGNPWAVYAFQTSRIATITPWLSLDYEWNFGASFGWHPFNETDNPRNRIIGSKINAYINAGFFLNARLSRYCNLLVGLDLTHYSNGNTHIPNSGLNTIGGRVGLVYTLNPTDTPFHRKISKPEEASRRLSERISYDLILYGATRAKGLIIGNEAHLLPGNFGILGFNFNPMYRFNRHLKAGISLDGQYDESANIYTDEIHSHGEKPQFYRPPLREQIGIGLSARGEFSMPFFAINIGIGHNLYSHKGDLKGLYQIVALKVSVTRNLFLHIGYQLHKFHEPNNLMLGIGYRFNNR